MKGNETITQELVADLNMVEPQNLLTNLKNLNSKLLINECLVKNLSGGFGAMFVRFIYQILNIDEHHIFRWRPENKFIQYLLLNHYSPGCMPHTLALSDMLYEGYTSFQLKKINVLFKTGYFLKATLGHATRSNNTFDRTSEFEQLLPFIPEQFVQNEKWILQKKLHFKYEYRVHSFGKEIIPELTFTTEGFSLKNNRSNLDSVERFVFDKLRKLPETIINGTLIGWDVGKTFNNIYYIIEGNFTGFHPQYCRGFQTSGYVDDKDFGAIICVWLNHYFKSRYSVCITSIDKSLLKDIYFYQQYMLYLSIITYDRFLLLSDRKNYGATLIIYLDLQNWEILVKLITYFQLVNIVMSYIVITIEECLARIQNLFHKNPITQVFSEESILGTPLWNLVVKWSYKDRKELCCSQVQRMLPNKKTIVL